LAQQRRRLGMRAACGKRKPLLLNRTIIESSWKNKLNANYHPFSIATQ
jgi:hypothetical protein